MTPAAAVIRPKERGRSARSPCSHRGPWPPRFSDAMCGWSGGDVDGAGDCQQQEHDGKPGGPYAEHEAAVVRQHGRS